MTDVVTTTETALVVDRDVVLEQVIVTDREFIVDTVVSLVETPADLLLEQVQTVQVVDATQDAQVFEVGLQGPPGPQGLQGPSGPSGASTVGGLGVTVSNPQVGDLLLLNTSLSWVNDRVLDGGNF